MAKKRVHELAKQYDMPSQEVMRRLTEAGIAVKAAASAVDEDAEDVGGRCHAILANGRRCPNAALPSSRYCGLDSHQALQGKDTDVVGQA